MILKDSLWILFTLIAMSTAPARATIVGANLCTVLLDGRDQYREGVHLSVDQDVSVLTRTPEPGSLEDKHPGLARALFQAMYTIAPYFRWEHASPMQDSDVAEAFGRLWQLVQSLDEISARFNLNATERARFDQKKVVLERRIQRNLDNHNSFVPTSLIITYFSRAIGQMHSDFIELITSSLIDGEQFWLGEDILKFYRGPLLKASGVPKRHKLDQEIDVIVRRRNGRDLWIEVKNNAMDWSLGDYARWSGVPIEALPPMVRHFHELQDQSRRRGINDDAIAQAEAQVRLRDQLKLNHAVDILWVSKFPLPEGFQTELKEVGVFTWPLHFSTDHLREKLFRSVSTQITDPRVGF